MVKVRTSLALILAERFQEVLVGLREVGVDNTAVEANRLIGMEVASVLTQLQQHETNRQSDSIGE